MPTEQEILHLIRKAIPNAKKYLLDDAAIIENNLIITTDTLIENTHFTLKTHTAEETGSKALAVNLSDIAAMGGKPLYALVSLSLPKNIKLPWIKNLYKGINKCAKKYKTQIIGGNITRSKEINITIAVFGTANKPLKRSSAKPGDLVFVTGIFGNAARSKYKTKVIPHIELGQKIAKLSKGKAALMDASDGLADCLLQISKQSNVKIVADEDKIPIPPFVETPRRDVSTALYGGEDYELVGTANQLICKRLIKNKKIKIIGKALKGKGAYLKQNNNKLVKLSMKKAFKHFL